MNEDINSPLSQECFHFLEGDDRKTYLASLDKILEKFERDYKGFIGENASLRSTFPFFDYTESFGILPGIYVDLRTGFPIHNEISGLLARAESFPYAFLENPQETENKKKEILSQARDLLLQGKPAKAKAQLLRMIEYYERLRGCETLPRYRRLKQTEDNNAIIIFTADYNPVDNLPTYWTIEFDKKNAVNSNDEKRRTWKNLFKRLPEQKAPFNLVIEANGYRQKTSYERTAELERTILGSIYYLPEVVWPLIDDKYPDAMKSLRCIRLELFYFSAKQSFERVRQTFPLIKSVDEIAEQYESTDFLLLRDVRFNRQNIEQNIRFYAFSDDLEAYLNSLQSPIPRIMLPGVIKDAKDIQ